MKRKTLHNIYKLFEKLTFSALWARIKVIKLRLSQRGVAYSAKSSLRDMILGFVGNNSLLARPLSASFVWQRSVEYSETFRHYGERSFSFWFKK